MASTSQLDAARVDYRFLAVTYAQLLVFWEADTLVKVADISVTDTT
ncbi:MAG: hypothetical protein QM398_07285 [Thermoproteota archaeon]|jgi:hypothetical protein|nr:hypothetical protein [Thermoproteota archaeon]NLD66734.1 hypothetical protein [Thermoproteota archaeon]